jgi:5-methylcytosine-specific restriction protein A
MPNAPPHPCARSGCRERIPRGQRYCSAHAVQYERQRRHATKGRMVIGAKGHLIDFYQSPLWRAIVDEVKAEEPLCRLCLAEQRTTPTYAVDHIIPRTQGGPDTRANCQGLCATHHSAKTMAEMRRSA